jgi:hypothetical protein
MYDLFLFVDLTTICTKTIMKSNLSSLRWASVVMFSRHMHRSRKLPLYGRVYLPHPPSQSSSKLPCSYD